MAMRVWQPANGAVHFSWRQAQIRMIWWIQPLQLPRSCRVELSRACPSSSQTLWGPLAGAHGTPSTARCLHKVGVLCDPTSGPAHPTSEDMALLPALLLLSQNVPAFARPFVSMNCNAVGGSVTLHTALP